MFVKRAAQRSLARSSAGSGRPAGCPCPPRGGMPHLLQVGPTSESRHIQRSPWAAHRRPLSSQRLTSRCRSANAGRQARVRESPPGAGHAASGTRVARRPHNRLRCGSTCGLDRISGGTEFVRGDVCDGPGLASGVGGRPRCPTQIPGRANCMAARRAAPTVGTARALLAKQRTSAKSRPSRRMPSDADVSIAWSCG